MDILIVFFLILVALLLISMCNVNVKFVYNSEAKYRYSIELRFLFFKFKFRLGRKSSRRNKRKVEKTNASNKYFNAVKKIYYSKFVEDETNGKSSFLRKFLRTKNIIIKNIELFCIVSGDEASDIGRNYSCLSIAVCNIYNALQKIFDIKKSRIYIYPDFVNNKFEAYFLVDLKMRLINVVTFLIYAF